MHDCTQYTSQSQNAETSLILLLFAATMEGLQKDDPALFLARAIPSVEWLQTAINEKAWKCVRALLAARPQVMLERWYGCQAIHSVLKLPEDILILLLESGADVNATTIPQVSDHMAATALDNIYRRVADLMFPVPSDYFDSKARILLDYGARVQDWHTQWARDYYAARQDAILARRDAAVALYCALRVFHTPPDMLRLLGRTVMRLRWPFDGGALLK